MYVCKCKHCKIYGGFVDGWWKTGKDNTECWISTLVAVVFSWIVEYYYDVGRVMWK